MDDHGAWARDRENAMPRHVDTTDADPPPIDDVDVATRGNHGGLISERCLADFRARVAEGRSFKGQTCWVTFEGGPLHGIRTKVETDTLKREALTWVCITDPGWVEVGYTHDPKRDDGRGHVTVNFRWIKDMTPGLR
jgi:hypothetical protein